MQLNWFIKIIHQYWIILIQYEVPCKMPSHPWLRTVKWSGFQLDWEKSVPSTGCVILRVKRIEATEVMIEWAKNLNGTVPVVQILTRGLNYPASRLAMTATDVTMADVPKRRTKLTETATKLGRKCKKVQTFILPIFISSPDQTSFWILTNQRRLKISGCHPMADIKWRP